MGKKTSKTSANQSETINEIKVENINEGINETINEYKNDNKIKGGY